MSNDPLTPRPDEAAQPSAAAADPALNAALDAVAFESLRPVALGLGVLYLIFAISHALVLPASIAPLMAAVAAATALVMFGLRFVLARRPIPPRLAHPLGAGIAGLAFLNSLLHLYLTGEPQQTTNLMLLIVGAGFLLLSTRLFALLIAATLGAWVVVAARSAPSPAWLHFGFALFTATVLAAIVHTVRTRTLRRLERLRLEERGQRAHLEKALRAVQWSERRMGTLLESASEGIVIVREDSRIALVNARIEELFGYSREELLGRSVGQLVPTSLQEAHAGHCADYFHNPRTRPMGAEANLVGRRKDGSEFPVDISLSPVTTPEETLTLAFVLDITRRRQAEEVLQRHSEQLEEMVEERTRELRVAQAQILSQQRLQQEIELAAQVQASLLPRRVPTFEGFEFAAAALPARYVSGDLYDFIVTGPQTCFIILADIAGKGIPAALLTSTARTLVRAETEHEDSPAAILTNVNRSLSSDLEQAEMFITFLVARLDTQTGIVTYANAGHTETLCWRQASQTGSLLAATGMPIGILADASIDEETITLRPGNTLVFYSDGILEASNAQGELLGADRLLGLLSRHDHLPAHALCQTILDAVETFQAGAPISDDVTLVILRALPRRVPFRYPATLEYLRKLTGLVRQAASVYGSDFAYQMELAASEVVTNVIKHAYTGAGGEIRGQITLLPNRVELDLYDDGAPFDLPSIPPPDLAEPHEGGYGLLIVRKAVDEVTYTPASPDGNHWRLVKFSEER